MAEKNLGDLKTKFKVDVDQMEKLVKGIKAVRGDFDWLSKNLTKINTELNKTLKALQGIQKLGGIKGLGGASPGSPTGAGVALPLGPASVTNNIQYNIQNNNGLPPSSGSRPGGGGGPSTPGRSNLPYDLAAYGMQAVTKTIQAMNQRMDQNYDRSLSADKLGVYYQQQKGITQTQYVTQMRKPLTDQRLGYGGISTLLSMQAATGLDAEKNAAGIAGMRAMSGYSISTEQLAQQAATLSGPAANNRMTMMLGTGMYGLGGKQKSMDKVMQQIVQRTGLTNENRLAGARQIGSNTRAMLTASGVPEDMIDQVLDYANSNLQYQKKTGKTDMYDPSKKDHRQKMGIEENFATQAEETARVKENRDENYYSRQADNLAQFEKNTQAVTKALGNLEDKLSGIVGKNISTRGSIGRKIVGGLTMAGGAIAIASGAGAPLGLSMMGLGATMMGDPDKTKKGAQVPIGYGNKKIPLTELASDSSFSQLNSTFKQRLNSMFEANPNVGLGDGKRNQMEQESLFLSRYRKVTDGSAGDVEWNGDQYVHTNGPTVAPPGSSMHELGLAADLVGDLDWVAANASKFGLKSFSDYGEPWHVQPSELPKTRAEYEKQGSMFGGSPSSGAAGFTSTAGAMFNTTQQPTLPELIKAASAQTQEGAASNGSLQGSRNSGNTRSSTSPTPSGVGEVSGALPTGASDAAISKADKFVQQALKSQGDRYEFATGRDTTDPDPSVFDCSGLVVWAAAQSGYTAPGFGNMNADEIKKYTDKTGGTMSIDEAKKSRGALLYRGGKNDDPNQMKHVAISLGDGTTMEARGTDYGVGVFKESNTWTNAGVLPGMGDPVANMPKRGDGTNVQVGGATNVTIAPNIYVTSTGNNSQDASRMAQELARLLENNIKRELLRTT